MWALLRETVNPNSRDKSAQPQLVGELLRAVLTGSLYPSAMFTQTEIRLRAEKEHYTRKSRDNQSLFAAQRR